MKHLVVRRRRLVPIILLLIFFLSFYLWIEERIESFTEKKLEQLINCDVKIEGVKGGIITNLVLINPKLLPRYPLIKLPAFEAKRVEFNLRLWDILFGEITLKDIFPLVITRAKLSTVKPILTEVSLQISPKSNRGDRSAQVSEFWCRGNFYLFGDTKMEFLGDMAISKDGLQINRLSIVKAPKVPGKKIPLQQKEERIDIEGKIDSSYLLADVKLVHFKIGDVSLSTHIKIKNEIAAGSVKGEIISSNSIMDYKPIKEIKASYELSASQFRLIALEWGEEVRLSGIIELSEPTYVDLLLELSDINLGELAFLAGVKEGEEEEITGLADGEFVIKGFLPSPDVKGGLVSRDGNLGGVAYDQLKVNLEGKSPVLKIVDSWIRRGESYATLEGELDLAKVGSAKLFRDVEVIFDEKAIVWKGWDITRNSELELELGKDIGDDFRVSFKTFMNDELLDEEIKEDEFGLDYKISEDETLKMRLKEGEEFLGIEHKLKF